MKKPSLLRWSFWWNYDDTDDDIIDTPASLREFEGLGACVEKPPLILCYLQISSHLDMRYRLSQILPARSCQCGIRLRLSAVLHWVHCTLAFRGPVDFDVQIVVNSRHLYPKTNKKFRFFVKVKSMILKSKFGKHCLKTNYQGLKGATFKPIFCTVKIWAVKNLLIAINSSILKDEKKSHSNKNHNQNFW